MNDYHFGRKEAIDARDANFSMRLRLDPLRQEYFPRGLPQGNRHYRSGPVLNQLKAGTCVAHSWTAKVNATRIMQQRKPTTCSSMTSTGRYAISWNASRG